MTKILKILILENQNIDVRFNLSLDAGKAGLLDPKCEEGWVSGSKKGSFFGRLNELIAPKAKPSWNTLAGQPDEPEVESRTPGRTHLTAHAFRMT